jgi:hypothetical protein
MDQDEHDWEIRDLFHITAILIRKLGGDVTVTQADYEAATENDVRLERVDAPDGLTIRLRLAPRR